jgi:hypothetical protein
MGIFIVRSLFDAKIYCNSISTVVGITEHGLYPLNIAHRRVSRSGPSIIVLSLNAALDFLNIRQQ